MSEFGRALLEKLFTFSCHGVLLELGSSQLTKGMSKHYRVWSVSHDLIKIDKIPKVKYIFAPRVRGVYDERALKDLPLYYDILLITNKIGRMSFFVHTDKFCVDKPIIIVNLEDEDFLVNIADKVKRQLTIYGVNGKRFAVI